MKDIVSASPQALSRPLRGAIVITAAIDLLIGLTFLFGPELGLTLWPTPIALVLMRFIGSIVFGNGIGALLVARQGTWEGARVLFAVAWCMAWLSSSLCSIICWS